MSLSAVTRWVLIAGVVLSMIAQAAEDPPPPAEETPERTLYVTATAHLDTQWLWTIQDTINKYVPDTLRGNFELFEAFPNYQFSFEGAYRYMLAREYYPDEYARLREYVAKGRWHVCGSAVDACDVNIPSPESLIRQTLYGNEFFRKEFGKTSCDIFLPDCFGFGYALPSVAAHCGLKGFSTQKLTWGSSVGIPFDIGVWEGVDGNSVVAALNPGAYARGIRTDLNRDEQWLKTIDHQGETSGLYAGFMYFGVGDVGGAPDAASVERLEKAIAAGGPIRVRSTAADQLFRDLTPEQIARLPRHNGELLMTRHGIGCYTSQAVMKRWNRKNELLAAAAEPAAVAAAWLQAAPYPREKLTEAWIRFLWHQFHDDLTGTSIPQAYTYSWNDELISLNQFAAVLTDSVGAVAKGLNTKVNGIPLVVMNPLSIQREDLVEATIRFPGDAPAGLQVHGPGGDKVPTQVLWTHGPEAHILFVAAAPPMGLAVYDVRATQTSTAAASALRASERELENQRYRVQINEQGDVSSIFDKKVRRELLREPIRLALFKNEPEQWPEWEIAYKDITADPVTHFGGPAQVRVVEHGPVRVALEVSRSAEGSACTQRIRLAAGDAGRYVEFDTGIDWRTRRRLLKAVFPLAVANEKATYDLGFGVVQRGTNTETLYEVPAQQWADLTDARGDYGIAILNDGKYGWDKPADHVLRLTLIHSPNDILKEMGWHRFTYAVCGHEKDWRAGGAEAVAWQAARMNQPLRAFQVDAHPGPLARRFSLARLDSSQVMIRAIKKAQTGEDVVVRLHELSGHPAQDVTLAMSAHITAARELNGAEEPMQMLPVSDGRLSLSFKPYQARTIAVTLAPPPIPLKAPTAVPLPLPYDVDVVSTDANRADGDFDDQGRSLPAELLPRQLNVEGIPFQFGPTGPGEKNAVACNGQSIRLPDGSFNRLYLLAAAVGGDATAVLSTRSAATLFGVQEWTGFIGQWNSLVDDGTVNLREEPQPPFVKTDPVAWVGTHRHCREAGNEAHVHCYLFKYAIDLPADARTVTLPRNPRIRVLAATAARDTHDSARPVQPLYDTLPLVRIEPRGRMTTDPVAVRFQPAAPDMAVHYTLDGTVPDVSSPRYTEPISIGETTLVRARAARAGVLAAEVSSAQYTFLKPMAAVDPGPVEGGLTYEYFEGRWGRTREMESLGPVARGTTEAITDGPRKRENQFGFRFSGYIQVPRDGLYTFTTRTDDGSTLFIGDKQVVDNDGLHGTRDAAGSVALKAGYHPITVWYFEAGGDKELRVFYEGPDIARQEIPAAVLFHKAEHQDPPRE